MLIIILDIILISLLLLMFTIIFNDFIPHIIETDTYIRWIVSIIFVILYQALCFYFLLDIYIKAQKIGW